MSDHKIGLSGHWFHRTYWQKFANKIDWNKLFLRPVQRIQALCFQFRACSEILKGQKYQWTTKYFRIILQIPNEFLEHEKNAFVSLPFPVFLKSSCWIPLDYDANAVKVGCVFLYQKPDLTTILIRNWLKSQIAFEGRLTWYIKCMSSIITSSISPTTFDRRSHV